MSYQTRKITIKLSPDEAVLEYCKGFSELSFVAEKSDILDAFTIKDILNNFDTDDLLEAIGQSRVEQWVSENNQ